MYKKNLGSLNLILIVIVMKAKIDYLIIHNVGILIIIKYQCLFVLLRVILYHQIFNKNLL